jgi:hypothetical protein
MAIGEVHQGDVGTTYRVRCLDRGVPFDPTDATIKELIFKMPQGVLVKPATVEQIGDDFYLVYIADEGFHSTPGKVQLQGHVKFANGEEYHSQIQSTDEDGDELRVHRNIEVEA